MRTLSEEQFKKEYGTTSVAKINLLDDNRFGNTVKPPKEVMKRIQQGAGSFTNAIGLGGATDVFGRLMARQGIGTDTQKEVTQQFVPKPTGLEVAGAVAQTATIPAGAIFTGGASLPAQVAVGAGLGYIYDVGSDFASGETGANAFKPGAETVAGAAIPLALRGAGALAGAAVPQIKGAATALAGFADDATRGARSAVSSAVDSLPTTGIGQRAREFASRFPRAARRVGEYVDEGAEIAARKQNAPAPVVRALDEGIPLQTVDFVQNFDTPTRQAAKEMLDLAEAGRGSALPQTVPGRVAGSQLDLVETQRQNIGKKIGEFSDSLSTQRADITPTVQNLDNVLTQNGIQKGADGKLLFDSADASMTPTQRKLVQEMYDLATERAELSPKQIHQMDQLFSTLQREARFNGVADVFVEVPTADGVTKTNIYKVFRDTFGQRLDEIAEEAGRADIRELNREYRALRNLTDNVESTIVRQSKLEGVNVDAGESASVALRRLFSNASSRAEYQQVYDQLDAMSRSLGYEGARADTLMDFYLTDMKPLFPDTVPQTSFEGGIRGAISGVLDRVAQLGSPNVKDQQKALRELLELTEEAAQ